jgi:hypothetical protein
MTAFSFYANVVPLNVNQHKGLRANAIPDFGFARKAQSVAVGAGEIFDCAVEFPVVFVRTPNGLVPVALLGARADENLFVTADGKWDAGYLPAFVRRYPFVTLNEGEDRISVGIDADSKLLQEQEGERLFDDDGQTTEAFKGMIKFLERSHADFLRGEALARTLDEKGLLQPMNATMTIDGAATIELGGFEVVDVAKLDAMSIGEQGLLAKAGDLALIHAHLVSMRNFRKLLARVEKFGPLPTPHPEGEGAR